MERIKMNQGKSRLLMTFGFLLACLLFSFDASAQYYPKLVDEVSATTRLNSEIPVLEDRLENQIPGTPSYALTERQLNMCVHTNEMLISGEGVANSMTAAYQEFAVDQNGHHADADEFMLLTKPQQTYGDSAFDRLVNLLKL